MKHTPLFIAAIAMLFIATSLVNAQVTLLTESFESPGSPNLPTGWTSTDNKVGGTNDWKDSTLTANSGTRVCYSVGATTEQIVTTPVVDFSSYLADSVILFGRKSGTFNATLGVEVSTDGGTSWTNIDTAIAGTMPTSSFKRYAFAIPSIVNAQANVKFRYRNYGNGTGAAGTTRLDDFEVRGLNSVVNDGDGSATVQNGAGTYSGSTIFSRNTGSQTVIVTVTGTAAGTLDKVKVTVPGTWSGYNSANVTLGGAFAAKTNSGTGTNIQINSAALGTTPGTITITGLTSSNPNSAGQNGNDTWTVQTAKTAGTLTDIANSPESYTIIPLSNLRTGGTDGFGNSDAGLTPVLNNNTVAVQGIITVPNRVLAETTSTSIIIQEGSYGLQIFKSGTNSYSSLTLGKEIVVKGGVTAFNGNTEIIPASVTSPDLFEIGTPGAPSPTVIANATDISEANEGKLVQINSVNWDSAGQTFITLGSNRGRNNFMKGVDSGTVYLNSVNNAVGNTIPSSSNIVGIVYHRTDIAGGGIQPHKIAPRNQVDLGFNAGDGTGTASITPSTRFGGVTGVAETLVVAGDGTNTLVEVSVTIPSTWTWTNTASRTTSGTGFSGASVAVSGDGSGGNPYVITISSVAVTNANTGTLIISSLDAPSSGLTTFTVKTRASGGVLSPINSSPTVNLASGFEAVNTGNWNTGSTWLGGVVPGASDDVTFTTKSVVVTITANAQCHSLTMTGIDTTGGYTGPVLQFDPSASVSLTVNGRLDLSGSIGRPTLTSNGNANATLITKGYMFTSVSNTTANGNKGLNMNEGTVKMLGSTSDSLRTGAGFRLANLIVGDGTDTKTITWVQTSSATMNVRSLTIKTGSSLILGGTTQAQGNSIGNNSTSGLPMLSGGVTVETGASLTVNNASAAGQVAYINIKGGGLTNNGTINLLSGDNSRRYRLAFGGLTADTAVSKQSYSGTGTGTFYHVGVGGSSGADTLIVNKAMPLDTMTIYAKGVLQETSGFTARGTVIATRDVPQSATESFGGIGAVITPADAAMGSTTVVRKDSVTTSGNNSIRRRFDITPTTNTGLNAAFEFHYDDSELGGQSEATFAIWKSTDGVSWSSQGGTLDNPNNKITLTGVNDFSRWTVTDAGHPLTGNTVTRDYPMINRWNMISVPLTVADYTKSVLFPTSTSSAYSYNGTYQSQTTLANGGGYWLKFPSAQNVSMTGDVRLLDTLDLVAGWNMVGSISDSVTTSTIVKIPGSMSLSVFYGYTGSYNASDKIYPGKGYWVKASVSGQIVLEPSAVAAPKRIDPANDILGTFNTLTITDKAGNEQTLYFGADAKGAFPGAQFELPPVPPQGLFDARFASQRYAEAFPAAIEKSQKYPIAIQATDYPVTVRWHIADDTKNAYSITDEMNGKLVGTQSISKDGEMTMSNPNTGTIVLTVDNGTQVPTEFALGANYPNPFNPTTKLVIAVPMTAQVQVAVYDILGRKISTLLNEEKSAGYHTIEWNGLTDAGTQAGSGVYFVRMSSGTFTAVHKMMMMK